MGFAGNASAPDRHDAVSTAGSEAVAVASAAPAERLFEWIETHRLLCLGIAALLTAALAFADWQIEPNVSLGVLYAIPLILFALIVSRLHIAGLALVCAIFREALAPFRWTPGYQIRILVAMASFSAIGLLVSELNRNRRLTRDRAADRERHFRFSERALEQLRSVIEASPLSFLITDANGKILMTNRAACDLLENSSPAGENLFSYLPTLAPVQASFANRRTARLQVEAAGKRKSGEAFLAHVWLTSYLHPAAPDSDRVEQRIAIAIWDASDDVLGHDLAQAENRSDTAGVLLATFSHEIHNLSDAAGVLISRIGAPPPAREADMATLRKVVQSLSEFTATGLKFGLRRNRTAIDLERALEHVHLTVSSMLQQSEIDVRWDVPAQMPRVYADETTLVQVFLNLALNSERALRACERRQVRISAEKGDDTISFVFRDSGPGVANPESLFKPFESLSGGAGLGLFLSRAMLRSYGGDLYYRPESSGSCFVIRLLCAHGDGDGHTNTSG
ncbi:MAG: PAS domain-containing protein [Bryobacteraceae bacterium]|nr:PAS domain-containing protein [Bryobacteraceae bacterium]